MMFESALVPSYCKELWTIKRRSRIKFPQMNAWPLRNVVEIARFAAVSDLSPALVANLFVAPRLRNLDCANPIIIIRDHSLHLTAVLAFHTQIEANQYVSFFIQIIFSAHSVLTFMTWFALYIQVFMIIKNGRYLMGNKPLKGMVFYDAKRSTIRLRTFSKQEINFRSFPNFFWVIAPFNPVRIDFIQKNFSSDRKTQFSNLNSFGWWTVHLGIVHLSWVYRCKSVRTCPPRFTRPFFGMQIRQPLYFTVRMCRVLKN